MTEPMMKPRAVPSAMPTAKMWSRFRVTAFLYSRARLLQADDGRRLRPQVLEPVVLALGGREDVYHYVAVIEQHPAGRCVSFAPQGAAVRRVAHPLDDVVDQRADLA